MNTQITKEAPTDITPTIKELIKQGKLGKGIEYTKSKNELMLGSTICFPPLFHKIVWKKKWDQFTGHTILIDLALTNVEKRCEMEHYDYEVSVFYVLYDENDKLVKYGRYYLKEEVAANDKSTANIIGKLHAFKAFSVGNEFTELENKIEDRHVVKLW